MKLLSVTMAFWSAILPIWAQESAAPQWDVEIPVLLATGRVAALTPTPEPIDFQILTSHTRRVDVTEAPEMHDLPPIKGTINVTVQTVEDPGLPDPPPPLPATLPTDPAVIARMKELRKNYRFTEHVFVSATVYDHSRTFLRIYPNGNLAGEISAWSNVDFTHFSGFTTYRVNESDGTFRDYGLLMGVGNTDTYRMRKGLAAHGRKYLAPEIPEIPDLALSGPKFVVAGGQTDGEAMDTLSQVHDLYRKEGVRMEAAYHAREKARAERKAYLLANPPVPEDVVIRFWKPKKRFESNLQQEVSPP